MFSKMLSGSQVGNVVSIILAIVLVGIIGLASYYHITFSPIILGILFTVIVVVAAFTVPYGHMTESEKELENLLNDVVRSLKSGHIDPIQDSRAIRVVEQVLHAAPTVLAPVVSDVNADFNLCKTIEMTRRPADFIEAAVLASKTIADANKAITSTFTALAPVEAPPVLSIETLLEKNNALISQVLSHIDKTPATVSVTVPVIPA